MLLLVLLIILMLGVQMPVLSLPGDGSDKLKVERRSLNHDGIERTYGLFLPHSYDGKTPAPLLFLFHGGGSDGRRMAGFTGFDKIAKSAGLIIICPDGLEKHWNDGRVDTGHIAHDKNVDDVGFVSLLLDNTCKEFNVDRQRVYASGISNGAMMSYRLGLEMPDKIAAIAPVVGALPEPLKDRKWTGRPVPAIIINGTADPLVPFDGGEVHFYKKKLGRVISVPETVQFWAKHNQCSAEPIKSKLNLNNPETKWIVDKTVYGSCADDADIEFYAVEGGGHTWPQPSLFAQYLPAVVIGKACRDMDSTELIWDFFKRHALKTAPKAVEAHNGV
ncbi:MAG: hypothetical protein K2X81_02795 [Candidatus Obscuribacterales bacterium]|nr:hypothetical protein [Candidatus Obscuribacterales bacterium]